MLRIFKDFSVVLLLFVAAGAHAQDAAEAKALAAWPKLARRDGDRLLVMNHGGGRFSDTADVFIDGQGNCQTYRFTGAQMLFDGYTRRREPVAELTCVTADGPQSVLVRQDGSLLTGRKLTASADGHYIFIEGRHEWSEDDHGKPIDLGTVASIAKWTIGGSGGDGPFTVACTQSRPDGLSDFRAWCTDTITGKSFKARIAAVDPAKPDNSFKRWRVYNLSDPADDGFHLNDYQMISSWNMADPFILAGDEARAMTAHPGLVRRDGPDLVLLDNGREATRVSDERGCAYWFFGKSADLYDARKGAKAPVAEIYCQRGEFHVLMLAPPYAPSLRIGQNYVVSDDGKTVAVGYGSTDIIDWQSRQVMLHYPLACHDLSARGNDHFSAQCANQQGSDPRIVVTADFNRVDGVWTVSEQPKK